MCVSPLHPRRAPGPKRSGEGGEEAARLVVVGGGGIRGEARRVRPTVGPHPGGGPPYDAVRRDPATEAPHVSHTERGSMVNRRDNNGEIKKIGYLTICRS